MRTLKYVDLMSLRKGVLGYPTSFTNACFFVSLFFCVLVWFFCFIVCFIANALKSGHCVICIRPVGSSVFFFICRGWGGGGKIKRRDGPNVRQGCSRGKWGYAPWEILKFSLSVCVNAIFAF